MPNLDPNRETPPRNDGVYRPALVDLVPDFGRMLELCLDAVMRVPNGKLRDEIEEVIDDEIATKGPGSDRPARGSSAREAEIEVRLGRHYAYIAHCRAVGMLEIIPRLAIAHDIAIDDARKTKSEKAAEEATTPTGS